MRITYALLEEIAGDEVPSEPRTIELHTPPTGATTADRALNAGRQIGARIGVPWVEIYVPTSQFTSAAID